MDKGVWTSRTHTVHIFFLDYQYEISFHNGTEFSMSLRWDRCPKAAPPSSARCRTVYKAQPHTEPTAGAALALSLQMRTQAQKRRAPRTMPQAKEDRSANPKPISSVRHNFRVRMPTQGGRRMKRGEGSRSARPFLRHFLMLSTSRPCWGL